MYLSSICSPWAEQWLIRAKKDILQRVSFEKDLPTREESLWRTVQMFEKSF